MPTRPDCALKDVFTLWDAAMPMKPDAALQERTLLLSFIGGNNASKTS